MAKKSTDAPAKMGRPTVMTDDALRKVRDAIWEGMTVEEACDHAEIGVRTFYTYKSDNEDFRHEIESIWRALDENMNVISKRALVKAIKAGDAHLALDYLKNTDPAFSTRTESKTELSATIDLEKARAEAWDALQDV